MKKHDKTKIYSDSNKTTAHGDAEKLTKETVHNIEVGDNITLNNKEYKILEIISESTGEAVIYKIESVTPKSPKGDFAAATKKSPSGDLGAKQAKANFNQKQKIYALKLYFEFKDAENEPNTEALDRIRNIKDIDILRLYDFGTSINKYKDKFCFEISDFAYGHDLLRVENLKEKYNPRFIEKELIPQIFKGILRLHENNIYHCDLKPQNVFYLDKEQTEIVIGDYGSAKTFEFDAEKKSRKTTTVKGTDFYLPPEQARGFISEKNDYYSFGMILLHLFYPEKILLNESEPKSLSHSKLKQIIERQFEAKPIIDFNPKYERINKLIEGLTLVDFNLRWGEKEVKNWLEGKSVDVYYKKEVLKTGVGEYSEKTLIFGTYKINSVYDLRDYILNEKNWYADLIEDELNQKDFMNWFRNLYGNDRSKSSKFFRIVEYYSQEGVDIIADAIIRFFIPEHPVILGLKSFDLNKSTDLKKTTALVFSHLIFNLWDSSSDKDIQLYFFRYEFALRQIKDEQPEVINLLNILYKELNTKEKISADFHYNRVYAYTSVSKKSLNNIKRFLCEYLPAKINIAYIKLNVQNELHYKLEKTLTNYYTEIGLNDIQIMYEFEETISVNYSADYHSVEDFYKQTIDTTIDSICKKHLISLKILIKSSLALFKKDFINDYNRMFKKIIDIYERFEKEIPKKIKQRDPVKSDLKEFESIITGKKYHKFYSAFLLFEKIDKYRHQLFLSQREKESGNYSDRRIARRRFYRRNNDLIWILSSLIGMALLFFLLYIISEMRNDFKSKKNYENFVDKGLAVEKIEMVYVAGGTFIMGNKEGQKHEKPEHSVILNDFYFSKYEITNEQFCHFLNIYNSDKVKEGEHKGEKMIYYSNKEDRQDQGVRYTKRGWRPSGGYEDYPVIYITWYGANEYCRWANGRLPTEAEWEYAAGGGYKSKGFKFSGSNNIDDVAWHEENSEETHKVGEKAPNELGIYDMSGNVLEWCEDWYSDNYYIKSPEDNPVNLNKSNYKVVRGGSYYSNKIEILQYYRDKDPSDTHYSTIGFRLCSNNKINNN
ncbi:MAG: SUMF1/EgtB/PvdO family nonheme iron enzyme [Bacteroidales bacterium]|nr:SUMF1/EgtB/PvdO family nonheme iron enzyme [Bacteroidales bacterium]